MGMLLSVRGIRKSFGAVAALRHADLDMAEGEVLSLIHIFGVELPALADHLEDGLVELGDGRIGRVVRVGKAEVAGLGAGAAAHAGLFVYFDSRAYLALQDVARCV